MLGSGQDAPPGAAGANAAHRGRSNHRLSRKRAQAGRAGASGVPPDHPILETETHGTDYR